MTEAERIKLADCVKRLRHIRDEMCLCEGLVKQDCNELDVFYEDAHDALFYIISSLAEKLEDA